jgi:hypothetical protein
MAPEKKMALEDGIIGKWREVGGKKTVQFFREGIMISVNESESVTAFYKFDDQGKLEIEPKYRLGAGPRRAEVIQLSIDGDQLTLTDSKGKLKYKKEP